MSQDSWSDWKFYQWSLHHSNYWYHLRKRIVHPLSFRAWELIESCIYIYIVDIGDRTVIVSFITIWNQLSDSTDFFSGQPRHPRYLFILMNRITTITRYSMRNVYDLWYLVERQVVSTLDLIQLDLTFLSTWTRQRTLPPVWIYSWFTKCVQAHPHWLKENQWYICYNSSGVKAYNNSDILVKVKVAVVFGTVALSLKAPRASRAIFSISLLKLKISYKSIVQI